MRLKTEEKRKEILEAASIVFEEMGYQRASMSAISARLGGSKATLYGYFSSKEALFAATIVCALDDICLGVFEVLEDTDSDIRDTLLDFGLRYLKFMTRPDVQTIIRSSATRECDLQLGAAIYGQGPQRVLDLIEGYLAKQAAKGVIHVKSVELAAHRLKGLLEAGVLEPVRFGVAAIAPIDCLVPSAIDAFLRIYATPTTENGETF